VRILEMVAVLVVVLFCTCGCGDYVKLNQTHFDIEKLEIGIEQVALFCYQDTIHGKIGNQKKAQNDINAWLLANHEAIEIVRVLQSQDLDNFMISIFYKRKE